MILTSFEVANIKKEIAKKFSVQVHFHDGCGGQYFTVEKMTEELQKYITYFFAEKNMNVLFSENGGQFFVEEIL